jgi:lipoprotein NlpI
MSLARPALAILLVLAVAACATYREQLARSQVALEQNQHERALALLRDIERDFVRLRPEERAQYAYLRGMTDYRIGHRADARHWLALARAYDEASTGTMPADWRARANDALAELNALVEAGGFSALASQKP